MKQEFKVLYDLESDILYMGKEGQEDEFIEIVPGVNIEIDEKGEIIGFEIFRASQFLKEVVPFLNKKLVQVS